MTRRKEAQRRLRAERLAREREAEARAQQRQRQFKLLVVGAVAAVFAAVFSASLLLAGSSDDAPGGGGSSVAVPEGVVEGSSSAQEGGLFPDFRLTEAGGRVLTRESLRGKPSIVWFTTSYCVPCQVGARDVAKLDDELGGDRFDVLVVFVDPQEPTSVLEDWRSSFANDDWMVALDAGGDLSSKVGLQFLDSKFLLDGRGVLDDVDLELVDDDYLDLIRAKVEGSS